MLTPQPGTSGFSNGVTLLESEIGLNAGDLAAGSRFHHRTNPFACNALGETPVKRCVASSQFGRFANSFGI